MHFPVTAFNAPSNLEILKEWYEVYGIPAILYRLKDDKDEVRKAYGHSIATYSSMDSPDKVESIPIKFALFSDNPGYDNNPGSQQLSIVTSMDHLLMPGDQLEFEWTPIESVPVMKFLYYIQEQPESFYETFQRVNVISQLTISPTAYSSMSSEQNILDLTVNELMGSSEYNSDYKDGGSESSDNEIVSESKSALTKREQVAWGLIPD